MLLLHGILLTRILLVQSVHLGLDDAHLGRREVALVGQGVYQQLDKHREDQYDKAEAADVFMQEIEHGDNDPTVDPAHQPAA